MQPDDPYRDIAQAALDQIWETGADHRFTRAEAADPGRADEAVPHFQVGESFPTLCAVGGHANAVGDLVARMDLREPFRDIVIAMETKPGSRRNIRVWGKPVFDPSGQFLGYRGASSDVTGEVESRQVALQAQIRLNDAVESMQAAFMLFDGEGHLVLWNSKTKTVFPNSSDHLVSGMSMRDLVMAAAAAGDLPEARGREDSWLQARGGDGLAPGTYDRTGPDGRFLRETLQGTAEGGTVAVFSDITALKETETALRRAKVEADEANVVKSRFLAAASHDLRQPLHAFGLLLSSLSRRLKSEENRHIASRMEAALTAIHGMFDSLLDMSRLDAGVMTPEIASVELAPMLETVAESFHPVAEEKGIVLTARPTDLWVRTDPMLLERILRNLVSNAIRYSADGRVLIAARRRGQMVRLEIWDTGIGIDPEDQRKIFNEFHRLGKPVKDSMLGLGLGLSIVDRLARLLEHRLEVASRPGKGSVFAIEAREVPPAIRDVRPTRPVSGDANSDEAPLDLAIAVLDDDAFALESMCRILASWGCAVTAAETLELFTDEVASAERELDLLLVDFHLGTDQETGLDAIERARAVLERDIPAVLITGSTDPQSLERIRASGVPWRIKPVNPKTLRAAIEDTLAEAPVPEPVGERGLG